MGDDTNRNENDKTIGDTVGNANGDGIGGTDDGLTRRLGDNDSTLFALVHQSHQVNSVLGLNAAPFLAMANENEQHLGYTPADISNRNLRSSKENMYSSPSPFSKVKGTDIFKNPFHQANFHDDTNRNENDKTIGDTVGNDNGDGIGGTDDGLTRRLGDNDSTLFALVHQSHQVNPILETSSSSSSYTNQSQEPFNLQSIKQKGTMKEKRKKHGRRLTDAATSVPSKESWIPSASPSNSPSVYPSSSPSMDPTVFNEV